MTASNRIPLCMSLIALATLTGCLSVKTEHEIKPIQITMDVNLKVQKDLETFLDQPENAEVRERRRARRDAIATLIKNGMAEEGNDGYLIENESADKAAVKVIFQENTDRKVAYEAIARKNNQKVDDVAKRAAEMNKKRAQ